jgi:phosphatidylglycerophosphate synthase
MLDRSFAWAILLWAATVLTLFSFRLLTKGRTRFDRIDKIGGSVLLSQRVMEAFYWTFGPVVRLCVALGITANMITWGSLVTGISAGFALALGHFGVGGFLGLMGMLLDTFDGMVARATQKSSDSGEVLDAAADRYTEFFYIGGLAFYYRQDAWFCAIAMFALLAALMISYSSAKAEAMHVPTPRGTMRRHERGTYLIAGAVFAAFTDGWELGRFDRRIGVPMLAGLALIALVGNASAVRRFMAVARSVRAKELAAREAGAAVSVSQPPVSEDDEDDEVAAPVLRAASVDNAHAP